MCGRYTLTCPDPAALGRGLGLDGFSETRIELRPRYNVAPGQRSPVLRLGSAGPVLSDALWGFVRPKGGIVVNARSETAKRSGLFRDAYAHGRCLVPADGFFEWRKEGRVKQPYLFVTEDRGLFAMAGLWQDGRYVVLTRDATASVAEIHARMPVVLSPADARRWLERGELGEPPPLTRRPVSTRVNRPENDDPECLLEPT